MVVNHSLSFLQNEDGQSVLEIVFVLPFLFIFVALLFKLNMAIQMAINNTQYSRSQLYVLNSNSPEYPRFSLRFSGARSFAQMTQDEMVLGVADPAGTEGQDDSSQVDPIPQTQKIARVGTSVPGSSATGEVVNRTEIRVRNTAAICTQLNSAASKVPMFPENIPVLKSKRWPFGQPVCQYKGMSEG